MSTKRQFGIKAKITAGFSLVFILLSLMLNFYGYNQVKKLLVSDNDQYLLAKASALLNKTELSPTIIPLPDKNTSIRILYHANGKQVIVFESPGIIKQINTPATTGVTDTMGMRVAYLSSNSEENPAELVMAVSDSGLKSNLHFLLFLLLASSFLSVLVSGGVAYVLSFYLLRPVQRIIDAAKKINADRLHDTIPVKTTGDELQELTETINAMLLRIGESAKQQQNFFASASHELKTPLAILKAELEVNLNKPDVDAGIKPLLQSQLTEINRLQRVVQEFLLVSQVKSGGMKLLKEPVDISAEILRAFNRFRLLMKENGLTTNIEFDQESDGFVINADKDKIAVVLMNVVENAAKYAQKGTLICCAVAKSTSISIMQIKVSNFIEQEKFDTNHLHEVFYRAVPDKNGTGIGLWLCREIVGMHGGEMKLISNHYRFEIVLELPIEK